MHFSRVHILCHYLMAHSTQISSNILLVQINIWDTNPIETKSQAFLKIHFFPSLLISRIFQLAAVNKIHLSMQVNKQRFNFSPLMVGLLCLPL